MRNAPSAFKSNVWTYFGFYNKEGTREIDMANAICRECCMKNKYSGNTTNLRLHLTRHHPEITLVVEAENDCKAKPPSPKNQPTQDKLSLTKLLPNSERAKKITQITFMCKDLRPYSVVENEGFGYMLKTLEPRYVPPLRRFFTDTDIPKLYREVKRKVEESLSTAERITLTCDAWTSRAVDSCDYNSSSCHRGLATAVSHSTNQSSAQKSHWGKYCRAPGNCSARMGDCRQCRQHDRCHTSM